MNEKNLVEMQIPVEKVKNIDELVSERYYGNKRDAIQDIIRRSAAQLRSKYWCVKTRRENL